MFLTIAFTFVRLSVGVASAWEPVEPVEVRPAKCVLELPVYDQLGNRLPFRVTRVVVRNQNATADLLGKRVDGILTSASGDRVLFSSDRIVGKRAIEVSLQGAGGARLVSSVFVTSCKQRHSLVFGESDLGLDVAFVAIRGRLLGCTFTGDWWVRSVAMFGGHEGQSVEDGYVAEDGTFTVQVSPKGVRRLLVIGKGREPLKSLGVDLTTGRSADVGSVNLTGECLP